MPAPLALFESLVDYAGLFPPAGLAMSDAVRNHAAYLHGPHEPCLGRFIVPVSRLPEFERSYMHHAKNGQSDWRLGVIAGAEPASDEAAIKSFNSRHASVQIVSVETKATQAGEIDKISDVFDPALEVWVEIPGRGETAELLGAIKGARRGAKIRLGGVTHGVFPPADEVAHFLAACHQTGVVCKATAGLHHPLWGEYPLTYESGSATAAMFGFLNVVLAATLLHTGGNLTDATRLLTASDPQNFGIAAGAVTWSQYTFTSTQIASARQSLFRSIGSCSFIEPIDGLLALRWL